MFAIIESGGKQYRVSEGDVVRLESLTAGPGETVELPVKLLAGDEVKVGQPLLEGASVKAEVLSHGRGDKLYIYKFKAKNNYRRKNGHRQPYTEVRITGISASKGRKAKKKSEEKSGEQEANDSSSATPPRLRPDRK